MKHLTAVIPADRTQAILQELSMERPLAFKLAPAGTATARIVMMEPVSAAKQAFRHAPAIVCVRSVTLLADKGIGLIDAHDVVTVVEGDWTRTVLVEVPELPARSNGLVTKSDGDSEFLDEVRREAPQLYDLAKHTITAIRAVGVDGQLRKSKLGRWVNHPVNVFTLKVQPRAGNLHFTLYGNPSTYDAGDFLLKDQNSYSRGWVRGTADAKLLAKLAREAHVRRSS